MENIIQATVNRNEMAHFITLEYQYNEQTYSIEIPKTDQNKHLVDGQKINAYLSIDDVETKEI